MKIRLRKNFQHYLAKATFRERMLIFLLSVFALLVWTYSCLQQTNTLCAHWKTLKEKIKKQAVWLQNGSRVQKNIAKILSKTTPKQTLSCTAFSNEVEALIRAQKITYSIDSPHTNREALFDTHTLQLHCENATIENLIEWEKAIANKIPYGSIEKILLHANEQNPKLLEVECSLNAIQIKDL